MATPGADASGEDDLIARYFRPIATDPGAFGLIDDAAILKSFGDDVVVTTDAIVEGVHFLASDPPDTIARKALRVNLSDLAAKGAKPAGFVLTIAMRDAKHDWLSPFAAAIAEDVQAYACPLLGGDTVSTPGPTMISITAFGRVPVDTMVRRTGAQPGDRIVVTGTIGDAMLGLRLLTGKANGEKLDKNARDHLIRRYRIPQPRNALALAIREHANAAMDLSDGLAGDLAKLCQASTVSAQVELSSVPLSDSARAMTASGEFEIADLVAGGDDYEVLCTIPENRWSEFSKAADWAGVPVCCIGSIVPGSNAPRFLDSEGKPVALKRLSYSHF